MKVSTRAGSRPGLILHKVCRWGLLGISVVSLSACGWLDIKLRQAAFRPTPASTADLKKLADDVEVYFVPHGESSSRISLYWFAAKETDSPTVLYLHGVFRNVIQNAPKIEAIRNSGFNVLAVDYRGWGLSSHLVPSASSIAEDADIAFSELVKRQPLASKRIIFGHSMGAGAALELAARLPTGSYRHLALESAFASTRSLTKASRWYGALLLPAIGNPFDNTALIGKITTPISIMHGVLDATVPIVQGEELLAAAPKGTRFEQFEQGRHSDLHTADATRYLAYWRSLR